MCFYNENVNSLWSEFEEEKLNQKKRIKFEHKRSLAVEAEWQKSTSSS